MLAGVFVDSVDSVAPEHVETPISGDMFIKVLWGSCLEHAIRVTVHSVPQGERVSCASSTLAHVERKELTVLETRSFNNILLNTRNGVLPEIPTFSLSWCSKIFGQAHARMTYNTCQTAVCNELFYHVGNVGFLDGDT